jgi:hypothetical protein
MPRKKVLEEATSENEVNQSDVVTLHQVLPRKRSNKLLFGTIVVLIIVVVLVAAGYFYNSYTTSPEYKQKKAEAEVQSLVEKVGQKMLLPEGTPTVFVVSDPEALISQQAFFAGAEVGDVLLVYSEASKAIIYSEARDLIVNVGPVTFDQPTLGAIEPTPSERTVPEEVEPATAVEEIVGQVEEAETTVPQ